MITKTTTRSSRRAARRFLGWTAVGLVAGALGLPLAGCGQQDPGPAEKAGKKIDEAVGAAKESAEEAAEKAKKLGSEAVDKTKEAAEDAKNAVKDKM
jgi:hypothetical protein